MVDALDPSGDQVHKESSDFYLWSSARLQGDPTSNPGELVDLGTARWSRWR